MTVRALVVGGTSGIGYAMACRVAAETASPAKVIICGRTKPKVMPHDNMEFHPLDATSMHRIKRYTDSFKAAAAASSSSQGQKKTLDLLIMTQGIMSAAGRIETAEGIDRKMALHYYGKQLLVRELLPVLKDDGKVIIVYDGRFGNPDKLNWEDLDLKTHFSLGNAANHCMVMNDVMIQYHATRQQQQQSQGGGGASKRHFIHAWPGAVNSNLLRDMPGFLQPVIRGLGSVVTVTPDVCAEYLLKGAAECSSTVEEQGRFWSNIDNKGRLLENKTVWSEEQMDKVADHTWKLIDAGLETSHD